MVLQCRLIVMTMLAASQQPCAHREWTPDLPRCRMGPQDGLRESTGGAFAQLMAILSSLVFIGSVMLVVEGFPGLIASSVASYVLRKVGAL